MSNLKYKNATTIKREPFRSFVDDLVEGSVGIKGKGETYLRKEQSETVDSYTARLSKATYFDSFNPTIDGLVGLIFENPIVYSDDIPTQLSKTIENADRQGNHFDILIERLFTKALQKGISFCLIDMPSGNPTSKADEIEFGIRPYLTIVEPENITSWKTEIINGQIVLTQVKILEFVEVEDTNNPYATKMVEQYRILERGTWQIWQIMDKGTDNLIEEGVTNLDYIPLVGLNLNEKGFFDAMPPLYDLGDMNVAHYQIFADSRYSAHVASVPFYFGSGIDKEDTKDLVISPNTFFSTHNSDASIEIIDYKGDGVAVNATLLDRIEARMREIGLSIITEGNTTATEVTISSKQSQSKLNSYTRALIDAVELILLFSAKFYGKDEGGSVAIDADILTQPLTAQDVIALNNIVSAGNLSQETMWKMIKSGSFKMPEDFEIEAEKERINSSGLLNDARE